MRKDRRSDCPITFSLDLFGDRWTLLILRDMALFHRHYYREFLGAAEGISTNILADRLDRLVKSDLVKKARDSEDRKQFRYTLTDKGVDLIPVLLEMIAWGITYDEQSAGAGVFADRVRTDRHALIKEIRASHQ